jgi:alpha-L-rhamnosidase
MTGPSRRDALSGAAALAACLTAGSTRAATAPFFSLGAAPGVLSSEHAAEPIGLDAPRPRLAWRPPVARQSAWRVQVAASEADLLAGRLTWDSGKVADAFAVEAVYVGPALPARARRAWRVRLWDADGRPGAWSAPSRFEMGLLAPEDWGQAAWIGRRLEPPRGWADQTLTIDFTLKGRFFDVLFRARPEGKTYGDAYALRVGMVDDLPSLMLQIRQYPGGASSQVKLKRLQIWPLPAVLPTLKGQRRRLVVEAHGPSLRFSLDGVTVGAIEDATQAEGTFGFLAPEAEAAVIHAVDLRAADRPGFASRFEDGDNPFTGGDVTSEGLVIASGVPGKDLVVPLAHPAPLLRRAFTIQSQITSARLYVAAGGWAAMTVNGVTLDQSALATGWTAYDKRVLYQTHDVTSLLQAGENVLAAELGRGWYGIAEPNEWYLHKAPWTAEPALKARLEIVLADGSTQVLTTDETWRTTDGPCLWDSIYAGERRDARREPPGWRAQGFDDRAWDAALPRTGPAGRLVAAVHEPIAPVARHAAVAVKAIRPGVWLFDFGRIRTGIPELSLTGPAGRTVSMVLAEKLRKDGAIQVASGLIDAQLDDLSLHAGRPGSRDLATSLRLWRLPLYPGFGPGCRALVRCDRGGRDPFGSRFDRRVPV